MKFSSKMDNLTLTIFIVSIFVFPVFILLLIHTLMMSYEVNYNEIKINSLLLNLEIKYENILKVEPKNFDKMILSEDLNLFKTALGNQGVEISYSENGETKTLFISPNNPSKFITEIEKHNA